MPEHKVYTVVAPLNNHNFFPSLSRPVCDDDLVVFMELNVLISSKMKELKITRNSRLALRRQHEGEPSVLIDN